MKRVLTLVTLHEIRDVYIMLQYYSTDETNSHLDSILFSFFFFSFLIAFTRISKCEKNPRQSGYQTVDTHAFMQKFF